MSSRVKIPGIDRRYLYILLFIVVSIPLLNPLKLPIPIGEHSRKFYDKIESLSAGSIVIISFDYGPSTRPENYPQSAAALFHAHERGCKIVALAFWPSGAPIGDELLKGLYGSDFPNVAGYGTEVVYLGYVPGNEVGMQTFGDNTATAKSIDHYGNDVTTLPLLRDECRSAADFAVWIEIASGTPGEQQVIQFVQGRHGGPSAVPILVGATAVSVPGMMPFYPTQISGILNGLAGAGEYEYLLNIKYGYPYDQGPSLDAQSLGHVLILLFIVIGNISYLLTRSKGGKS
jgi:hypothetical protein